jgi:biotin transport system substrate-specific component
MASRDLALIAYFAALIAALGLIPAFSPYHDAVPITAQTLGVMLAGSILGARRGALAVVTFLVLVAAGLPLLAGGRGGLEVFTGASAGFLIGFVPGAFVIGWLAERRPATSTLRWMLMANAVGGIGVVYLFGAPVMAAMADLTFGATLVKLATFLPGDIAKVIIAAVVSTAVLRGYPNVLPRHGQTDDATRVTEGSPAPAP